MDKKSKSTKVASVKKNKVIRDWVNQHVNDHYVQMASKDGYRSRAAYKLLEIDKDVDLFRYVKCVVDLGSSPGSWSQVAAKKIGTDGFVLGVDLLPMTSIPGVNFIQGDFTENAVLDEILKTLDGRVIDLIVSDMSPNLSGVKMVDQSRSALLIELVLAFAKEYLKSGGNCIIKIFIGGEFDRLIRLAKEIFAKVDVRKPEASKSKSSETYLLCKDKIA